MPLNVKDLPTNPKQLVREYKRTKKKIESLESRIDELVMQVPTIGGVDTREYLMNVERLYPADVEVDEAMDAWAGELIEQFPPIERGAFEAISDLGLELSDARVDLEVLRTRAVAKGVELPGESPDEEPKAVPEDVAMRRAIVKAVKQINPRMKKINAQTCMELDKRRVEVPSKWQLKHGVESWVEAYDHPHVRGLIHKMFSTDRKA